MMMAALLLAFALALLPPATGHPSLDDVAESLNLLQEKVLHQDKEIKRLQTSNIKLEEKVLLQDKWMERLFSLNTQLRKRVADLEQTGIKKEADVFKNEHLRPSSQNDIDENETAQKRSNNGYKIIETFKEQANETRNLQNQKKQGKAHHVVRRSDDLNAFEAELSHVTGRVTELTAKVTALQTRVTEAGSSTYVQWGSSTCTAASAKVVYSGVVGGSWYDHTGAATNYLCLTMHPVFSSHAVPPTNYKAYLYGAEYETYDSHQDKDPVCAVCRAALPTTVMLPGTNKCEAGWTLQYSGFLMATRFGHQGGSEYICVDSRLESSIHTNANEDGRTLYYTVTRCGSLPCEPYMNNKVVTCAVCSK